MSTYSEQQAVVIAELPRVVEGAQTYVYVPLATSSFPGIAAYNSDEFYVENGVVRLRTDTIPSFIHMLDLRGQSHIISLLDNGVYMTYASEGEEALGYLSVAGITILPHTNNTGIVLVKSNARFYAFVNDSTDSNKQYIYTGTVSGGTVDYYDMLTELTGTYYEQQIAKADWQSLSGDYGPYKYKANISLSSYYVTHNSYEIRLINNDALLFTRYGFQFYVFPSTTTLTLLSSDKPDGSVTIHYVVKRRSLNDR